MCGVCFLKGILDLDLKKPNAYVPCTVEEGVLYMH